MANKKISALSAAAALTGAEQVPVVQNGATVQTTVADIQSGLIGTYVAAADDAEVTGRFRFRDGFVSRTVPGDTGFGGITMKTVGDTAAGVIDWLHDGDYGYLMHLVTGPNVHRPDACIGIGSDSDGNGLLLSNKLSGNGMFIDNRATVIDDTGAGHGIMGQQSAPGSQNNASLVYLYGLAGGEAPLLVLQANGTPGVGQMLMQCLGPASVYGAIKADDGAIDWEAPIYTTDFVQVNAGAGAARMYINANAEQHRKLAFQTGGSRRWEIGANTDAESGSDVGSNFVIASYTDAGATKTDVVNINRSTGLVTLTGDLAFGTGTGSKIGTSAAQKLAFYGATAIVQPTGTPAAAPAQTAGYVQSDVQAIADLANDLRTKLVTLGLIA